MGWWDENGRDETLGRLAKEGFSASRIAEQLGEVSRCAVIGRAHRKGIPLRASAVPPRKKGDPRQERWLRDEPILREMHAAGAAPGSIAERLGRPTSQISDKLRQLGLSRPGGKARPPNWSRPQPSAPRAEPTPLRPPVAAPGGKPVPFLDRRIGQCCWPLWEPPARTGMVCAASTGSLVESYCASHRAIAWRKQEAA
jgi:GcrA cell cycle regulator